MANRNFYSNALARNEQAGRYSSKRNTQDGGNRLLRSIDGDNQGPVFEDPRNKNDRRCADNDEGIPASGCRRRSERRSDRLNLGVWWMKRNYCVDLVSTQRKSVSKSAYSRLRADKNSAINSDTTTSRTLNSSAEKKA